jgi:glycosyltransferase involved in cell wall biosynthesis
MKPLRILVIWGETLSKPGSGTAHCRGLIEGWDRDGHSVAVVTPEYGEPVRWNLPARLEAVRLGRKSLGQFLRLQLLLVTRLPGWLRQWKPDAVYVRTCFLQGLQACLCRLWGTPLIGEVDSMVDEEIYMRGRLTWAGPLTRLLDCLNNRLSDGLVCVTPGLRDESIRRGAPPLRCRAIPNGAPLQTGHLPERSAARAELALPRDKALFCFAGNFAPWQGLDFLLDAVESLQPSQRNQLGLVLMGDGQQKQALANRIAGSGLADALRLLPEGPPERVRLLLAACDAAVIPIYDRRKLRYGLSPLKFWEALAAGLPVLVPHGSQLEGVLRDLDIPGLFDPSDPTSLADLFLATADRVDTLRARRSDLAHRVAERYSWLRVCRDIEDFMRFLSTPPRLP